MNKYLLIQLFSFFFLFKIIKDSFLSKELDLKVHTFKSKICASFSFKKKEERTNFLSQVNQSGLCGLVKSN